MGETNTLVDWEQLDMMAFGYTPEFVEIYHEFLEQTPSSFDLLDEAFRQGNAEKVAKIAHMIKGSVLNFGFSGVSRQMEELEIEAKDRGSLEAAADRIRIARADFERARTEVSEARNI